MDQGPVREHQIPTRVHGFGPLPPHYHNQVIAPQPFSAQFDSRQPELVPAYGNLPRDIFPSGQQSYRLPHPFTSPARIPSAQGFFRAPVVSQSRNDGNDQRGRTSKTAYPGQRPSTIRGSSEVNKNQEQEDKTPLHLRGLKQIPNPPDLPAWRQRLFDLDEEVQLTEDEFQTYFPHVDNVYSHRSTQSYKPKGFISHYWDCRLKGRPAGTPKSDDPRKKKRKRVARERNLCDVKIKITEHLPTELDSSPAFQSDQNSMEAFDLAQAGGATRLSESWIAPDSEPEAQNPAPKSRIQRYYTIQRVNGSGGNGKNDGVPGPHKHTLEDSDRIKKNSIVRSLIKEEKVKKKTEKTHHKKASGAALNTVKKHAAEHDLKLYGSCSCPFTQRVWISLEAQRMPYQYIEVEPSKPPQSLLSVNPRGLVPSLRHGDWATHESTIIMEYLEEVSSSGGANRLLPAQPQQRADARLWTDHINRHVVPAFQHLLAAQDSRAQAGHAATLATHLQTLVDGADGTGPFFAGADLGFVDVQLAPWLLRLSRVLRLCRAWPDPVPGSRWERWVRAVEAHDAVRATISNDDLYAESYERYVGNGPGTSQLANAVDEARGLP